MSTLAANVTGLTANVFSVILFVPGAVAVWRNRNDPHALRGASIAQQVFIVCNAVTWGVYAFLTGAYWAAAPGLINTPLALFTAALIYRVRASEPVGRGNLSPDPDQFACWRETGHEYEGVHGCDGCCHTPDRIARDRR